MYMTLQCNQLEEPEAAVSAQATMEATNLRKRKLQTKSIKGHRCHKPIYQRLQKHKPHQSEELGAAAQ